MVKVARPTPQSAYMTSLMPAPTMARMGLFTLKYRMTNDTMVTTVQPMNDLVGPNLSAVVPRMGLRAISARLAAVTMKPPTMAPRPTTSA